MRIGLIADVHGNREAFDAVLAALAHDGVDRIALLGDFVGYGADPVYVVERVAALVAGGALAVKGDYDVAAVSGRLDAVNDYAAATLRWTRERLSPEHVAFLDGLPLTAAEGERFYVHASAADPAGWRSLDEPHAAEAAIAASGRRVTLCGHLHRPRAFSQAPGHAAAAFTPTTDAPTPLLAARKWLAVIGACGQPRDEIPTAPYAVIDEATRSLLFRRAAYDVEMTARKIRAAGLPQILAARLFVGR
jgi:diadenosine tetraphosphatase ApaH/serine/threonine PP2A family protein phosphatase